LTGDETLDELSTLAVTRSKRITSAVRQRILQRLATEPGILPRSLELLPATSEATDAAWAAFGKIAVAQRNGEDYEHVRAWLRRRGHLREELVAAARNTSDDDGFINNEDDLAAFAQIDWKNAESLVRRFAGGDAPRTSALAHALLYRYGDAKHDERPILRSIAENTHAPARARAIAIEALMSDEWEGRDAWYLARFEDATLAAVVDGIYLLTPLDPPVDANPDIWIRRIATLMASPDKTVRTNAASILGSYYLDDARVDALQPLLPWLANPSWADDSGMHRLRLVQTVARLDLREAIPGLQRICRNDPDETLRAYAADALVQFRAPDAMAYARKVLEESSDLGGRAELEQSIVREAALSDEEIAELVIAYVAEISSPERTNAFQASMYGQNKNWRATLGMRFAQALPAREELAQRLIVAASQPGETTAPLRNIVSTMNLPAVHRWLASRLPSLAPDDAFLAVSLLDHRNDAAQHATAELHAALTDPGAAGGIAAIALRDRDAIHDILENGSAEARQGLFAAARLVREPLKIAGIVGASKGAESAAEALLAILNAPESRAALASMRPGEAMIWGERPWTDPGHTTFRHFDEWEKQLRTLAQKGTYERIYALAVSSYWGSDAELVLLGERAGTLLLIRKGTASPLATPVAARVRTLFAEVKPDDLPYYDAGAFDGTQYEFVSLTSNGGHRVFMNNPPSDPNDPYGRLVGELVEMFGPKR
jgi:hypothetical protein